MKHFVPLALYKALAEADSPPKELAYIDAVHMAAIKEMPLINRGRLSVQPVSEVSRLDGRSGSTESSTKHLPG